MGLDPLFARVDLNNDGVIDADEWSAAKSQNLLPAATKPPLDVLLDSFGTDGSGRLDAARVNDEIAFFNGLQKWDCCNTSQAEMQLCRVGADGKVSRTAAGAVFMLFADEPPERPVDDVALTFQGAMQLKQLFNQWTDEKPELQAADLNLVSELFNRWPEGEQPGRSLCRYEESVSGSYCNLTFFTMWAWKELSAIKEASGRPMGELVTRLRTAVRLAMLLARYDWQGFGRVACELFGPALVASQGRDWSQLSTAEREEALGRVSEFCGGVDPVDLSLEPKDLLSWIQERPLSLPDGQACVVLGALEDFGRICKNKDETVGRICVSFAMNDDTGDGVIERELLQAVLSQMDTFSPEEMDALMEGADTNKDGRVSYAEFAKWVMAAPGAA